MLSHHAFQVAYRSWLDLPGADYRLTEAGWITENTHLGPDGTNTVLDDWQVLNLNNTANYQLYVKSRQVGFSWVQALKKLSRADLIPRYNGIFLSINLLEAQEKLRYVREAWETLPNSLRKGPLRLKMDNKLEIEFGNGSRLTSFPSKAPRGRAGADLTLDEVAHIQRAKMIYDGTTAASIRSKDANVELGSSPLSASGLFYDIAKDPEGIYKAFDGQRFSIHWWDSTGLCRDPLGARMAAAREHWDKRQDRRSVEERVERWATDRFRQEFYSKSLDAFLQEFECQFTSDGSSLIALEYLEACSDLEHGYDYPPGTGPAAGPWVIDKASAARVEQEVAPALLKLLHSLEIGSIIYMGFDPARSRNQSVITLVRPWTDPAGKERVQVLARIAFRDTEIHIQEILLRALLSHPWVRKVNIDRTGIGTDLADRMLADYGELVATPIMFTLPIKAILAQRMQRLYESGAMHHPYDRDLIAQVYAVKKRVSHAGNLQYDAPESQDHHADAFWSLALAALDCPDGLGRGLAQISVPRRQPDGYRRDRREMLDRVRSQRALRDDVEVWKTTDGD